MSIRRINKYLVSIRFSLSSKMFDENDIIYIEEVDGKDEETQVVFDSKRLYVADIDGATCLSVSCINENLEMVKYLVTCGANVHQADKFKSTPLHWDDLGKTLLS